LNRLSFSVRLLLRTLTKFYSLNRPIRLSKISQPNKADPNARPFYRLYIGKSLPSCRPRKPFQTRMTASHPLQRFSPLPGCASAKRIQNIAGNCKELLEECGSTTSAR